MPTGKRKSARGFAESKSKYAGPRAGARSGERGDRMQRHLPEPVALPDGRVRFFLRLGPKGRILLPKELRSGLAIQEGDLLVGWLSDGELQLKSHARALRKIQEKGRRLRGNRSVVDEFIAEKRVAAARGE